MCGGGLATGAKHALMIEAAALLAALLLSGPRILVEPPVAAHAAVPEPRVDEAADHAIGNVH